MSDVANTPVTAETTIESKANSAVTFSDLEQMDEAEKRSKREKPDASDKPDDKPKDESGTRGREPVEKSSKGEKDEPKDTKKSDGKASADREDDDAAKPKAEAKAKPKSHKFRSGDQEYTLAGDAIVAVPIDGKKEDVPLQELINRFSGEVNLDRKYTAFATEKKAHDKKVEAMNSMVTGLFERAQKNPEDAWDFLAELTGKDPVEFKTDLLRKQRAEALRLAEMSDEDFEKYLKDTTLTWREKRLERHDSDAKAQQEKAAAEAKTAEIRKKYGVSDESYERAYGVAKEYLKGNEPSAEQVIYADRYLLALSTINETVPELEKREDFDNIVDDIVHDLMRHPSMTKEKLQALLQEVWGGDKKALKRLAEKIRQDPDADEEPRGRSDKKSEAMFFSDL